MKEQIFEIIKAHPGVRLREIAGYIHIWHLNKYFLKAMRELEMVDGKIYNVSFQDPANMEFYNKWYIKEN